MKVSQDKAQIFSCDIQYFARLIQFEKDENSSKDYVIEIKKSIELEQHSQIILKRIKAMSLPISFTYASLNYISFFCDRAGAVVLLLIDCLEEYEGQQVTIDKISILYPFGFYTEKAMVDRVENEIKQGKSKFSFVY